LEVFATWVRLDIGSQSQAAVVSKGEKAKERESDNKRQKEKVSVLMFKYLKWLKNQ